MEFLDLYSESRQKAENYPKKSKGSPKEVIVSLFTYAFLIQTVKC